MRIANAAGALRAGCAVFSLAVTVLLAAAPASAHPEYPPDASIEFHVDIHDNGFDYTVSLPASLVLFEILQVEKFIVYRYMNPEVQAERVLDWFNRTQNLAVNGQPVVLEFDGLRLDAPDSWLDSLRDDDGTLLSMLNMAVSFHAVTATDPRVVVFRWQRFIDMSPEDALSPRGRKLPVVGVLSAHGDGQIIALSEKKPLYVWEVAEPAR